MSQASPAYVEQLRRRATRTFGTGPIPDLRKRTRAIVGAALGDRAADAMAALRGGEFPGLAGLEALELSIRMLRPAPLVTGDNALEGLPIEHPELATIFPDWQRFATDVRPCLASIGRIDRASTTPDAGDRSIHLGTGFLVGPNLVLTNRHVVEALTFGSYMLREGEALVWFRREFGATIAERATQVRAVHAVSRGPDLALLEIEPQDREPLRFSGGDGLKADDKIAAVGFPGRSQLGGGQFLTAVFANKFGVKRAAPGEVMKVGDGVFSHDCSTLGGSSGSPLFAQVSAELVGVHVRGQYLARNKAVHGRVAAAFVTEHVVRT